MALSGRPMRPGLGAGAGSRSPFQGFACPVRGPRAMPWAGMVRPYRAFDGPQCALGAGVLADTCDPQEGVPFLTTPLGEKEEIA